ERIARPRLRAVTGDIGVRVVGALLLLPTASILIPLPSTNTVPGIGVAVAALGLIERDGLLVIGGLFLGLLWIALLAFFGLEAASLIKDFVLGGR
ncbi:MAG: exopolysaccharide biosynthesis protein, partial [Pseudomonadota bacterium]